MSEYSYSQPHPDLCMMLKQRQNEELLTYAQDIQLQIFSEWSDTDIEQLRKTLRYESALLDEASDLLQEDETNYAIFRLGSLLGSVESFERILYEQRQNQWALARLQKEAMSVKHLPEIVHALEIHGSMFHSELSEYLNLNPPTLTEAMKKVLETGAVQANNSGKYKIYSLTDAGLRFGKDLRKKKQHSMHLDDVVQHVRILLDQASTQEEEKTIKTKLRAEIDDRFSVEIHPGDILNMYCYGDNRKYIAQKLHVYALENNDESGISVGAKMEPAYSRSSSGYNNNYKINKA